MYEIETEFEYKGYKCVVIAQSLGHRCGYVGVDKNNVLYNKDYDDEEIMNINVHGGVTFVGNSISSNYPVKSDLYWLGFDCSHFMDKEDIGIITKLNSPEKARRLLQFVYEEDGEVRSLDFCIDECKSMINQIIEINKNSIK